VEKNSRSKGSASFYQRCDERTTAITRDRGPLRAPAGKCLLVSRSTGAFIGPGRDRCAAHVALRGIDLAMDHCTPARRSSERQIRFSTARRVMQEFAPPPRIPCRSGPDDAAPNSSARQAAAPAEAQPKPDPDLDKNDVLRFWKRAPVK